jgi:hypothetical protein
VSWKNRRTVAIGAAPAENQQQAQPEAQDCVVLSMVSIRSMLVRVVIFFWTEPST